MIVATFSELFGTELGRTLQAWCMRWGWPLVWVRGPMGGTDGVQPGRMLDPEVLARSRVGHNLTVPPSFRTAFEASWAFMNLTMHELNSTDYIHSVVNGAHRAFWTVGALIWGIFSAIVADAKEFRGAGNTHLSDYNLTKLWKALRKVTPAVLDIEPLRAGSCAKGAEGKCIGTTKDGDCVCYADA
jgi:hypothetical protein